MDIPTEQLGGWAKDLERQILAVRGQIDSLQVKLRDLEKKKAALDCLIGVSPDQYAESSSSRPPQTARLASGNGKGSLAQYDHAPYTAYWVPILEVLVDLGGKGHVEDVLPKVKQKMELKSLLGPMDYEDVPSGTEERWRNTARWQRQAMVARGLLRSDSPRGIWEINEEGRGWLAKNKT